MFRDDPSISFTERYRGTAWDTSPPPPSQPVPKPRQRAGRSWLLMIGLGCIATAGAGVALAFFANGPAAPAAAALPSQFIPIEASPAASTQHAMSTFHAPTASPRASASSTIPAPSRRPLFGPAAGFSAFMSHADRTYQVDCEGTFAIGNERATVDLTMKVSGEDSEGTSVIAQDRERSVIQSIVKDGVQYVRLAGEGWKKQAQPPTGLPVDAFDRLAPDMLPLLEDHGLVRRDGSELHLLRVPNLDWASMSTSLLLDENGAGVVIREMSMSVWVTPAGEPRVAEIRIDATGRANGLEVDVTFDLSYRFTRVGEPVEIDAPARYEDAGQTSS